MEIEIKPIFDPTIAVRKIVPDPIPKVKETKVEEVSKKDSEEEDFLNDIIPTEDEN